MKGYLRVVVFRLLGVAIFFLLVGITATLEQEPETKPTILPTLTKLPTLTWFESVQEMANEVGTQVESTTEPQNAIPDKVRQNCMAWSEVGEKSSICIYGEIKGLASYFYASPDGYAYSLDAFYFDERGGYQPIAFYLIASEGLKNKYRAGDCIVIYGNITNDVYGIPKIDGRNYPTNVFLCSEATF